MADVPTTILQLVKQEVGFNDNTWGTILNATIQLIEDAVAGKTALSTTGGSTTLTDTQARSAIIVITGILTSNAVITVPTRSKQWKVFNNTTGAFTVTFKTAAGTAVAVDRNSTFVDVTCDGTNCYVTYVPASAVPAPGVGTIVMGGHNTSEPNHLLCDGTLYSTSTFATLFAKISTFWGSGSGTFAVPDLREKYPRGAGPTNGIAVSLTDLVKAHTHTLTIDAVSAHAHAITVSDPTHAHTVPTVTHGTGGVNVGASADNEFVTGTVSSSASATGITATAGTAGSHTHTASAASNTGAENRPASACVHFWIKYQ